MKSLIFTPVGRHLEQHSNYENHWRCLSPDRDYEIVACLYKDFDIEPDTYDQLLRYDPGQKWVLAKRFLDTLDHTKYEYIGFFDDDLCTDVKSINRALEIAKENKFDIFQMSLCFGSQLNHPLTGQNKSLKYTKTNFVEIMCPFIHTSMIEQFKDLWKYHNFQSGWGLDCIVHDTLKATCAIVHEVSVYHKPSKSSYDRSSSEAELWNVVGPVYTQIMQDKYGIFTHLNIDIKVLEEVRNVDTRIFEYYY